MLSGEELGKEAWESWGRHGVPVFPCGDDKRPLVKWRQLGAVSEEETLALFRQFGTRARLIGAAMGKAAGIFALDFDLYKGPSAKEYLQSLMLSGNLPPTRIHETRSGGLHYLYGVPDGKPMPGNSVPADGVEIRGEGGYIIVPPSHGYKVQSAQVIEDAPDGLLNRLKRQADAFRGQSVAELIGKVIAGETFHEALTLIAAKMHSRGETPAKVLQTMHDAMMGSVAASPMHERHERWAKIMAGKDGELSRLSASAYEKYSPLKDEVNIESARSAVKISKSRNRDVTLGGFFAPKPKAEENFEGAQPKAPALSSATVGQVDEFPFSRSYNASAVDEQEDKTFILHPLIMESDVIVLSAEPKAGKTLVGMNIALHMAAGIPIGDELVPMNKEGATSKISVIYFALEGQGAIRKRVKAWLANIKATTGRNLTPDDLHLFVVEMPINLGDAEIKQDVVDKLVKSNAYFLQRGWSELGIIVFDTLTKAMPGKDQNSVEDTSAVFQVVDMMRESGVSPAVMFVHHNNRQSRSPRGSSNILAEPDTILTVTKQDNVVIDGVERKVHELSVFMARAIDDGMVWRFAAKEVEIGVNSQGINQVAPALELLENYTAAPTSADVTLRKAASAARNRFYDMLWQVLSDTEGMFLTHRQLHKALASDERAFSFLSTYINDNSRVGIQNAFAALLAKEEVPTKLQGIGFDVTGDGVRMLLATDKEEGHDKSERVS